MRTGTEFISEISAATIFTSFNFHIFRFSSFRFSGKGEVDVYRICISLLAGSLVPRTGEARKSELTLPHPIPLASSRSRLPVLTSEPARRPYVYVLYCLDPLSQYPVISPPGSFATNQLATEKPSRYQETITPPTNLPPNKVVEVN